MCLFLYPGSLLGVVAELDRRSDLRVLGLPLTVQGEATGRAVAVGPVGLVALPFRCCPFSAYHQRTFSFSLQSPGSIRGRAWRSFARQAAQFQHR